MKNTRSRNKPVSAEATARMAEEGKDVSRFFTNTGRRVAHPVNLLLRIDLQEGAPSRLLLAGWGGASVPLRYRLKKPQSPPAIRGGGVRFSKTWGPVLESKKTHPGKTSPDGAPTSTGTRFNRNVRHDVPCRGSQTQHFHNT